MNGLTVRSNFLQKKLSEKQLFLSITISDQLTLSSHNSCSWYSQENFQVAADRVLNRSYGYSKSVDPILCPSKKLFFRQFFLQKIASHGQTVHFRLYSVIHHWKALLESFHIVFLKKIFHGSCIASEFPWRARTDIFPYDETLSYKNKNIFNNLGMVWIQMFCQEISCFKKPPCLC